MKRGVLGTCNGCGLGVSVPRTAELGPGVRVVVLTEQELESILRPAFPDVDIPPRGLDRGDQVPGWRKRLGGFLSYQLFSLFALYEPDDCDRFVFQVLRDQMRVEQKETKGTKS